MGCRSCARIILITFNILFFICGVLLLAFGIVGVADPQGLSRFLAKIPGVENASVIIDIPATIVNSSVFMIILGGIMLVFGFFGCVGAWCMAKWMLFIYWFVLVLLLLAEVALIIVSAVSPQKVQGPLQQKLFKSLQEKFQPVSINNNNVTLPSDVFAVAWISMQFEVGCCGANNYTDYRTFNWTFMYNGQPYKGAVVPPSCCVLKTPREVPTSEADFKDLPRCLAGQDSFYTEGCFESVSELVVRYSYIPIIIAAIVIFIEAVAIIVAIYLWKSNDKKLVV